MGKLEFVLGFTPQNSQPMRTVVSKLYRNKGASIVLERRMLHPA